MFYPCKTFVAPCCLSDVPSIHGHLEVHGVSLSCLSISDPVTHILIGRVKGWKGKLDIRGGGVSNIRKGDWKMSDQQKACYNGIQT